MRIGPVARSQTRCAALLAAAAIAMLPLATFGQSRDATYPSGGSFANEGAVQAIYMAPADNGMSAPARPYVDANGNPMIVPTGYGEPCGDGCECCDGSCAPCGPCGQTGDGTCGGPNCRGGFMGPFPMGAGGTDPPVGYDLMNDTGIQGDLVDQRGPHYFDVRAEAVVLRRDKTFDQNINFTSENVGGPIELSSNQLSYGDNWGFRVVGRYDICPMSVLEFGYTGVYDFNSSSSFQDPSGNLYTLFSNFGSEADFPGVTTAGGPGAQTERAYQQSISLESDLQSAELSYRRYWLGWMPRVSGTLLAGFRYTRLNENFQFRSLGETTPESHPVDLTNPINGLNYTTDADNNLAGFQTGGDVWVSLMQGLRIGTEGKVGLYDNHYVLRNRAVTTVTTNGVVTPGPSGPPNLFEEFRKDQPALICEASADVVADLLPSLSFRAGYEVLFINSLVLAGDNFNTGSPYNPGPADNGMGTQRFPFVVDQSHALYTGAHVGFEYTW